jgi:hypothetical protein
MKEAGLGQETTCFPSSQRCTTVIKNIEGLGDVQVWAQWQGSQKVNTICERKDGELSCGFPYDTNSDRVDYWIRLGDCEESLGYSDGWLEKTEPEAEPLNNEPATNCCQVVKNEAPVYFRDPPKVGTLYLGFGLNCEQPWDFDPNTCATFDAYVGANRDIFWTNGECCIDAESPYFLGCKAPIKDQKKSATKIELRYGECMWDFEFQSPYEAPQESCDGTPCGNTCCAAGCVCDCWEGVCSCSC